MVMQIEALGALFGGSAGLPAVWVTDLWAQVQFGGATGAAAVVAMLEQCPEVPYLPSLTIQLSALCLSHMCHSS